MHGERLPDPGARPPGARGHGDDLSGTIGRPGLPGKLFFRNIDNEQVLPERTRRRDDCARVIHHEALPVEHELVLTADKIDVGNPHPVLPDPAPDNILPDVYLPRMVGGCVDVEDEPGARPGHGMRGTLPEPHVLAYPDAEKDVAVPEYPGTGAGKKISLFIEDTVVGEELLAEDTPYLSPVYDGSRVVDTGAGPVHKTDDRDGRIDSRRHLVDGPHVRIDKTLFQEQVLRGIARYGKLRQSKYVHVLSLCPLHQLDDLFAVSCYVAHR
ncbi:MAG: hypothetical protein A4E61_00112 [Syntrophorhabdus sp. PtaB.Bin184]|nr:MAG: hypothetical protein A4E61_00112 [Syntrophorhabdus sp. PtaB.Bin184]